MNVRSEDRRVTWWETVKGRGVWKFWQYSIWPNSGKLENSNHVEAYGESTVHDMPIFKIELAGNPNSCILKINKQKFRVLLHAGAKVSLIHTKVYKSLKNKPKVKETNCITTISKRGFYWCGWVCINIIWNWEEKTGTWVLHCSTDEQKYNFGYELVKTIWCVHVVWSRVYQGQQILYKTWRRPLYFLHIQVNHWNHNKTTIWKGLLM